MESILTKTTPGASGSFPRKGSLAELGFVSTGCGQLGHQKGRSAEDWSRAAACAVSAGRILLGGCCGNAGARGVLPGGCGENSGAWGILPGGCGGNARVWGARGVRRQQHLCEEAAGCGSIPATSPCMVPLGF